MSSALTELQALCDNPPADLVDYFDHVRIQEDPHQLVGLLSLADSVSMSTEFRTFHALTNALGLIFLDAAQSNHHCYITRGPLAGSILYLKHDDQSVVVFDCLADYLRAGQAAFAQNKFLDGIRAGDPRLARNQLQVAEAVEGLLNDELTEESYEHLLVLISAMDMSNPQILHRLAVHPDFYIAAAVGNAIARIPLPDLLPIAAVLSQHEHPQAANAGRRAIEQIRKASQ